MNYRRKGMDTVIFAPDLIEYAFLGVAAIVVARRRHHREQRVRGRRERIFFHMY